LRAGSTGRMFSRVGGGIDDPFEVVADDRGEDPLLGVEGDQDRVVAVVHRAVPEHHGTGAASTTGEREPVAGQRPCVTEVRLQRLGDPSQAWSDRPARRRPSITRPSTSPAKASRGVWRFCDALWMIGWPTVGADRCAGVKR